MPEEPLNVIVFHERYPGKNDQSPLSGNAYTLFYLNFMAHIIFSSLTVALDKVNNYLFLSYKSGYFVN